MNHTEIHTIYRDTLSHLKNFDVIYQDVSALQCKFILIFLCVCVCCPEALKIQAVMPKCGQGGRRSGEVWEGGRRTVNQVTFELLHHNTAIPDNSEV